MNLTEKITFWLFKLIRLFYYHVRYRWNKWQQIEGIYFPVYPEYGYSVLRFIDSGQYESGEINIIKKTITKDDIVLELGTGLGFISAFCSKFIGSERVYTFEANPLLENRIQELYVRNNINPQVEFAILGEGNGYVPFYTNKESLLCSSLDPESVKKATEIKIKKVDLNTTIKIIQPTYLIMDIEGGEAEIFKLIDFQTIKKIQVELHPDILGSKNMEDIFQLLKENYFERVKSLEGSNNYFFKRNSAE